MRNWTQWLPNNHVSILLFQWKPEVWPLHWRKSLAWSWVSQISLSIVLLLFKSCTFNSMLTNKGMYDVAVARELVHAVFWGGGEDRHRYTFQLWLVLFVKAVEIFFKCFSHSDCQYVTMNLSVIALQCLGQASYRLHTSYRPIPLYLQKYSGNKNNKKATSPQFSPLSSENLLSLTDWQAFLRIWFLHCFMKYLCVSAQSFPQTLSRCPILWQLNPMLFFL